MRLPNIEKSRKMIENRVVALASGGLDSCVMLGELAKSFEKVVPVYVRCGLRWEEIELGVLREFISALSNSRILPVEELHAPMADVYGRHWATGGDEIPGYHEPDERWEIPGRNLILIAKASVWCKLRGIRQIALGSLVSNPFSDASLEFFEDLQKALRSGLNMDLVILRPLAHLHKSQIIQLGQVYPLELTMSCGSPVGRDHCGQCGKCRERIKAFAEARVIDRTKYVQRVET